MAVPEATVPVTDCEALLTETSLIGLVTPSAGIDASRVIVILILELFPTLSVTSATMVFRPGSRGIAPAVDHKPFELSAAWLIWVNATPFAEPLYSSSRTVLPGFTLPLRFISGPFMYEPSEGSVMATVG